MTNKLPAIGFKFRRKKEIKGSIFREGEVTGCEARQDGVWILHKNGMIRAEAFFEDYEEIPTSNSQKAEEAQVKAAPNPVDFKKGEVNEVERTLEELKTELAMWDQKTEEGYPLRDEDQWGRIWGAAQNLVNALEAQNQDFSNPCLPEGRSCPVECDILQAPISDISEPTKEPKLSLKVSCNICGSELKEINGVITICGCSPSYVSMNYIQKSREPEAKSIWKDVGEAYKELHFSHVIMKFISTKHGETFKVGEVQEGLFYGLDGKTEDCIYAKVHSYATLTDFINEIESEKKVRIELEERVGKIEERLNRLPLEDNF